MGDVATGLLAPFVAYAWYSGKPYARGIAIAWTLFSMAGLVNAFMLGGLTNGGGRNRLPDRTHPGLWRAVLLPHPHLFTDRSAAQNLAATEARGIAGLRYGGRSRMSVTHRCEGFFSPRVCLRRPCPSLRLRCRKESPREACPSDLHVVAQPPM